MSYLVHSARILLGTFMIMAASYKAWEFPDFTTVVGSIARLDMLPRIVVAAIAGGIMAAEATLAVMLFRVQTARTAGWLSCGMLVVFTGATVVYHDAISSHCGCVWEMGGIIPRTGYALVIRNLLLIGLAYLATRVAPQKAPMELVRGDGAGN